MLGSWVHRTRIRALVPVYVCRPLRNSKQVHGHKWKMPQPLKQLLNRKDVVFTGRSISSDFTRLSKVFLPEGKYRWH